MTESFFKEQVRRLRIRFGEKNFDNEFVVLIWQAVHGMSEAGFKRAVDVFIGSRTANKPPLLSEFREAKLKEDQLRLNNDLGLVVHAMERPDGNLKKLLWDKWGVMSVKDAIAKERRNLNKPDGGDDGSAA